MAGRAACKNLFSFAAKSMVINTLHTAEELARAEICLHLTGGGIQIGPATELTLAKINAAIYEWTNGEAASISASATAAVKFRSTFRGTITKLNVWYHRTNVNNTGSLPLYVRLYDQTTGSQIYQSERLTGKVMSQTDTADTLTVAVPVAPNQDYRLELYSGGGLFTGTIGFGTMGTEALTGEAAGQAITSCSVMDNRRGGGTGHHLLFRYGQFDPGDRSGPGGGGGPLLRREPSPVGDPGRSGHDGGNAENGHGPERNGLHRAGVLPGGELHRGADLGN